MDKVPLEVGRGYVVDLGKEASVKVKRYRMNTTGHCGECGEKLFDARMVVLATDYDALLALARRLRKALYDESCAMVFDDCDCAACTVLRDSAWLEE